MIVPMSRIRILGPRDRLDATLRVLQDDGRVQLAEGAAASGVAVAPEDARTGRRRRQLERVLDDIAAVRASLGSPPLHSAIGPSEVANDCSKWARLANRSRKLAVATLAERRRLDEERQLITRYHDFLREIQPTLRTLATSPRLTAHVAVVPATEHAAVEQLAKTLRAQLDDGFTLTTRRLENGDDALLLVLPRDLSARLEAALTEARVPEVLLPEEFRGLPLEQAVPKMIERLRGIPANIAECDARLARLTSETLPELSRAERVIHDWIAAADARRRCGLTPHAFELEGWLPDRYLVPLQRRITAGVGADVLVEAVAREAWSAADAPVTLSNPRIFRPFERLVTFMPLPKYGSIDPTPFVAVFFPMFFGIMLGDVGYGILLAGLAVVLFRRGAPGTLVRTAAEIALPCALFAVIFGFLFGELFGDLGRTWLGLRPLWIDREEAVIAALLASLGLGVVHVTLGFVLGALESRHEHKRAAIGRAASAVMVLLVVVALLAAFAVLPARLFTPSVVALLVVFPVVVLAEGLLGTIELFTAMGNVLSYARVMAIGTASVILAAVANRMVGAVGSTAVGLVFALLFHLVNFAIGLFSPAIHALRLHYVEFFGRFYTPGGRRYEPFTHWRAEADASPIRRSMV